MRIITLLILCFGIPSLHAQSNPDWKKLQAQFPDISNTGSVYQIHFDKADQRQVAPELAQHFLEQRTRGFGPSTPRAYHPVAQVPYNSNVTLLVFYTKKKGQRQLSVDVWSVDSHTGKRLDSQDAVCAFGKGSSTSNKAELHFSSQGFEARTKSNYGGGSSGSNNTIRYKVTDKGKIEMQF